MNSELVLHLNLFVEATPDDSAIFFKNDDESPTVLTYNIIKYSYLLYISTHISESSSDSNHMT